MGSHECDGVSIQRRIEFELNTVSRLGKTDTSSLHYWTLLRGIHRWPRRCIFKTRDVLIWITILMIFGIQFTINPHRCRLCATVSKPTRNPVKMSNQLYLNPSRPSNAIWRNESRSPLAQVMACYMMVPSHYLNHWWLIITEVLWHSPKTNYKGSTENIVS